MNCFVLMPITDIDPYKKGHFNRVYEHLIKPACKLAGFNPVRADEILNTNYIALDIIKKIINSDVAICDLSGRNPNVLYELGIRQAFNLPVTLIKDSITQRIFDISGFRDIEYDENLRIDNVQRDVEIIAETLKNTYDTKGQEINSLISLLGINAASVTENISISKDTEVILSYISSLNKKITDLEKGVQHKNDNRHAYMQQVLDSFTNNEGETFRINDLAMHPKFGIGRVLQINGTDKNPILTIDFKEKTLKIIGSYGKLSKPVTVESN